MAPCSRYVILDTDPRKRTWLTKKKIKLIIFLSVYKADEIATGSVKQIVICMCKYIWIISLIINVQITRQETSLHFASKSNNKERYYRKIELPPELSRSLSSSRLSGSYEEEKKEDQFMQMMVASPTGSASSHNSGEGLRMEYFMALEDCVRSERGVRVRARVGVKVWVTFRIWVRVKILNEPEEERKGEW